MVWLRLCSREATAAPGAASDLAGAAAGRFLIAGMVWLTPFCLEAKYLRTAWLHSKDF